jgi:RIO-like serine/threonine protein kinase
MKYNVSIDEDYNEKINEIKINPEIRHKELFDYNVCLKKDVIDNLIDWISETKSPSDKELMKADLFYLINLKDDIIFSSILTNEYIAESDNEERFNELCSELLKLNNEVEQ